MGIWRRLLGPSLVVVAAVACSSNVTVAARGQSIPTSTVLTTTSTSTPETTIAPATTTPRAPTTTTRATTTTRPSTTSTTTSAGAATAIELTEADDGRTVPVHVGQTVRLSLGGADTQWGAVAVAPAGVLVPVPTSPPPARGVLMAWTASRAGTVQVTTTATAYCPPQTPCPQYARLFQVSVAIS